MSLSQINVPFSVTKIFFAVVFKLCLVRIVFELVAPIGLLKYWVLQTDWVWLPQEIWSSVAWLYSKFSWLLKFFAEFRETEWSWWRATRYHSAKAGGIIKDYAKLIFFNCRFFFLTAEIWNKMFSAPAIKKVSINLLPYFHFPCK